MDERRLGAAGRDRLPDRRRRPGVRCASGAGPDRRPSCPRLAARRSDHGGTGLVGWNVARQPPAVPADGGWPAAQVAAARVLVATHGGPLTLDSLPAVKPADALRFPVERLAPTAVAPTPSSLGTGGHADETARVVLCDQLFHETIGSDCGGPAEDAFASSIFGEPVLRTFVVLRFEAAPGPGKGCGASGVGRTGVS